MKLLLVAALFSCGVHAKIEKFTLTSGKKVTVDIPKNWESAKDLFGIPLAILGPWQNESRPVLSVLPTAVKSSKMPEDEFKKNFSDFKKEKDEWVKSNNGQLLSYEPVTSVELKHSKGHFIGAEFKINNVHFIERSYYLYCKEELYNLKYSIRDEHRKYIKDLQKMVEDFKCE